MTRSFLPNAFAIGTLLVSPFHGAQAKPAVPVEHAPLPVSVSSANYAETPAERLYESVHGDLQHNPSAPPLQKLAQPKHYVFAPGDLAEADLPFPEICRRLAGALAQKGFVNAADDQGIIREPERIDLILRVHSGQRAWKNPVVRLDHLTWRAGLVYNGRLPESILSRGLEVSYDRRAGGDDDVLGKATLAQDRTENTGQAYGTANSSFDPATGYDITRDFNLLVVEAFDYRELLTKRASAKRLWTTFVAVPADPDQKFSDVLNTMLRVATPYFGETTRGLQMFDDARANVHVGPAEVVESDVKLAPGRKK
jgi:hypothetical protein